MTFSSGSEVILSLKVTGVLYDIPENSTLKADFLVSYPFGLLQKKLPEDAPLYSHTFIEFGGVKRTPTSSLIKAILRDLIIWRQPVHLATISQDFNKYIKHIQVSDSYRDRQYQRYYFTSEPFKRAYFSPEKTFSAPYNQQSDSYKKGDKLSLLLLFFLAVTILAISCINVVNLFTAHSTTRAKEIAIRKVMGADRSQLVVQFLTESTLLSSVSLIISISLVELTLPQVGSMLGREMTINYTDNWGYFAAMASIAIITGVVSGLYPALFLSSFPIVRTLQGISRLNTAKTRKSLLFFQITSSACILMFTISLSRQLSYTQELEASVFLKEIYTFEIDSTKQNSYSGLKAQLLELAEVSHVSIASHTPWNAELKKLSALPPSNFGTSPESIPLLARIVFVDSGFLEFFNLDLLEGKRFNSFPSDSRTYCVINQAARTALNEQEVIGMQIQDDETHQEFHVTGVVDNSVLFNPDIGSTPLIIVAAREYFQYQKPLIYLRLQPSHPNKKLKTLSKIQKRVQWNFPGNSFSPQPLQQLFDGQTVKLNAQWKRLMIVASCVSILLATLGLTGFTKYEAELRTKEIGIRKAMGASRLQVCTNIVRSFVPFILLANIVAWTISILLIPYLMATIGYPYTLDLGLVVFCYTLTLSLLITVLTVFFQIQKVTAITPAEALRDE